MIHCTLHGACARAASVRYLRTECFPFRRATDTRGRSATLHTAAAEESQRRTFELPCTADLSDCVRRYLAPYRVVALIVSIIFFNAASLYSKRRPRAILNCSNSCGRIRETVIREPSRNVDSVFVIFSRRDEEIPK